MSKTWKDTDFDDDDDAFDENGLLKDGHRTRVPLMMRDGMDDTQRAIADEAAAEQAAFERQKLYDEYKADISNRWKGGLHVGDSVSICGNQLTAIGRNADTGKMVLTDCTSTEDADAVMRRAYQDYETTLTNAWRDNTEELDTAKAGGSCTTTSGASGRFCKENGKLVCRPLNGPRSGKPGDKEWELSGPLSDSEAQNLKDAAYAEYEKGLTEAWKK